jgi:hypothetical protein
MMRRSARLFAVLLMVTSSCGPLLAQQPNLKCLVGPVKRTYGNTPWLVYSCDDGQSIVIVTAPDSPAAPFYFIFNGGHLRGEGTGNKAATDAAYNDLQRLTDADIKALITQTKQVSSSETRSNDG